MRETLREMISRHEGRRTKPYKCSQGFWTIGVGWNMDAHALPESMDGYLRIHGEITEAMVDDLLDISIEAATNQARGIWAGFEEFTERRQWALIDLLFNMGAGKIQKGFPSFVRAVAAGDWQMAAFELKYADGKKRSKLSGYWTQLHGDPDGADDGRVERPEEIYQMLVEG